jgi:hypothetical protein
MEVANSSSYWLLATSEILVRAKDSSEQQIAMSYRKDHHRREVKSWISPYGFLSRAAGFGISDPGTARS